MGKLITIILLLVCLRSVGQDPVFLTDSLSVQLFERGSQSVNKCTPWHHLQCVYITGSEVYKDGSQGKSTRHWWRMSYIGQACTDKYGKTFGKIFEGFFVIPHYMGVGLGNGAGYIAYIVGGSDEIKERKRIRKQIRIDRRTSKTEQ